MELWYVIIPFVLLVIIILIVLRYRKKGELFDIDDGRPSSAWSWNTGVGYGGGYGTGYDMWGIWPANLPKEPWKNWMWARRPSVFVTPYTPVPQIDYSYAKPHSKPTSHYNVDILSDGKGYSLAVNGLAHRTLTLDRGRVYFFRIYAPGRPFMFTVDGKTPYKYDPVEVGMMEISFDESTPTKIYYGTPGSCSPDGEIYLNKLYKP